MADDQEAREMRRSIFNAELQDIATTPKTAELDDGFIYYRWYFSDNGQDYGIEELVNEPRTRWLLYRTGLANKGMFFYSVHQQDLAIDPMAGRPRIGPYAPPIRPKSTTNLPEPVNKARRRAQDTFAQRLKAAVTLAERTNQTVNGQIHCRWHSLTRKKR